MAWLWAIIGGCLSIGGSVLVASYLVRRKTQEFRDEITALAKDIRQHETQFTEHHERIQKVQNFVHGYERVHGAHLS